MSHFLFLNARRRGAFTAIALWLPLAVPLLILAWPEARLTALSVAGVVTTGVVGGAFGNAAVRPDRPRYLAVAFSLAALGLGALVWALAFLVLTAGNILDLFGVALVGIAFLGIPIAMLGLLFAMIWVWLLGAWSRRESRPEQRVP